MGRKNSALNSQKEADGIQQTANQDLRFDPDKQLSRVEARIRQLKRKMEELKQDLIEIENVLRSHDAKHGGDKKEGM